MEEFSRAVKQKKEGKNLLQNPVAEEVIAYPLKHPTLDTVGGEPKLKVENGIDLDDYMRITRDDMNRSTLRDAGSNRNARGLAKSGHVLNADEESIVRAFRMG